MGFTRWSRYGVEKTSALKSLWSKFTNIEDKYGNVLKYNVKLSSNEVGTQLVSIVVFHDDIELFSIEVTLLEIDTDKKLTNTIQSVLETDFYKAIFNNKRVSSYVQQNIDIQTLEKASSVLLPENKIELYTKELKEFLDS